MRFFFLSIVVLFFMTSCDIQDVEENVEFEIFEKSNRSAVFLIDSKYYNIRFNHEEFTLSSNNQVLFNKSINTFYFRRNLRSYNIEFDTIEIANSMSGRGYNQFYFLYNVRIVKNEYLVSLYYNFDSIKGTYKYEISNKERSLFNSLLDRKSVV